MNGKFEYQLTSIELKKKEFCPLVYLRKITIMMQTCSFIKIKRLHSESFFFKANFVTVWAALQQSSIDAVTEIKNRVKIYVCSFLLLLIDMGKSTSTRVSNT
jgi:hypothetical protein